MKRALILVLLLAYAASSIGATLHFHYCCGKLDDISFSVQSKKCAGTTSGHRTCCDTKRVDLKIQDEQSSETKAFVFTHDLAIRQPHSILYLQSPVSRPAAGYPAIESPPLSIPLFIYNCIWRI